MTTREYLGQIQKYDKLIKNKKYEEEHLRSLALGLKSFSYGEKVQSTPNPDQMTDAVSELVDIQTEIKKMVIEYTKKKQDIIETIDKVSDINSDLYDLLRPDNLICRYYNRFYSRWFPAKMPDYMPQHFPVR